MAMDSISLPESDIHDSSFVVYCCGFVLGPISLTWFNIMDNSNHMPGKMWDEITYPFSNFKGARCEVWEWISNFIPHVIMDVITHPC